MIPITIDVSGVGTQFNLASAEVDKLLELCIQSVTTAIYTNWEALAKQKLKSSLPEYLHNLHIVDKGRFAKQIILTGIHTGKYGTDINSNLESLLNELVKIDK